MRQLLFQITIENELIRSKLAGYRCLDLKRPPTLIDVRAHFGSANDGFEEVFLGPGWGISGVCRVEIPHVPAIFHFPVTKSGIVPETVEQFP